MSLGSDREDNPCKHGKMPGFCDTCEADAEAAFQARMDRMAMDYPCTGCGACCTDIREKVKQLERLSIIYRDARLEIPYLLTEEGACSQYDPETRRCKVYKFRPLPCRIKDMATALNVPWEKALNANIRWCNKEITARNLGDQYLIIPSTVGE